MQVRILPDELIDRIAAGEVVERPASVVKELVENALDAGGTEITINVIDGGRTLIQVADNGGGMSREDLEKSVLRHATSKLPTDDLLNINFMGFRGEALPSISSVSETIIETNGMALENGAVRPSSWESGTRVRVKNLFQKVPARLKFLRADRVEMMAIAEVVKRLALARPDIGFNLNDKYRYNRSDPLIARIGAIMGNDAEDGMLEINAADGDIKLTGFASKPTLRRASSIDQYLFVNRRPVKDKVLVGALRAAYFDVMHAREFPLCCLYLELPPQSVDVNVSPAKTDVHFLEPNRIRDFIVKALRAAIAATPTAAISGPLAGVDFPIAAPAWSGPQDLFAAMPAPNQIDSPLPALDYPLGLARAQIANKYILSETATGLIIIDQHAAHERITYEKLRTGAVKRQPLLAPEIIRLRPGQAASVLELKDELAASGLALGPFGEDDIAIYEKPADFDLDWTECLGAMADEVQANGHSSIAMEKLHLKLANYACHHSVRAGQRLSLEQMNALLRQIEETERGGECNHGRPVWRVFTFDELDGRFERS
ncbi:MAG: DNA mismatch repair endonuclease MutL [Rickettsiales bacterium]|jgi:DNA mismatch repair protein MutL|nr:DNA mismatch repair endonuclease MutL [Rickettsiales bacterium]